jgi:hypothetical protein
VVQDFLALTAADVVGGRKKVHDDVVDFVGCHGGRGWRPSTVGRAMKSAVDVWALCCCGGGQKHAGSLKGGLVVATEEGSS